MKKVLLIADVNSIHIYNFCKNFLSHKLFDVTLLDVGGCEGAVKEDYLNFYQKLNYKIVYSKGLNYGRWIYVKSFYKVLKGLGKFDYIHIHFVSHYLCPVVSLLSKNFEHVLLTYWGSDLFRSSAIKRLMTLPLISKADKITLLTKEMADKFASLSYPYRRNYKKCIVIDYGNPFFESIKYNQKIGFTPLKAKKTIGLNPNKITVAIGYSWRKEMQQYKALENILTSEFRFKDSVQFVIPAVGMDSINKDQIEHLLKETGVDYYFQEKFYNENEMPLFRIAIDVFIHPQTTDSLSCAMMEHLYSGSIVLNGSWLKYNVLDENDVEYYKFDDFSHLPFLLNKMISKFELVRGQTKNNQNKLDQFASWNFWDSKWSSLYDEE